MQGTNAEGGKGVYDYHEGSSSAGPAKGGADPNPGLL